jgi:hypothetical protein
LTEGSTAESTCEMCEAGKYSSTEGATACQGKLTKVRSSIIESHSSARNPKTILPIFSAPVLHSPCSPQHAP